MAFPEIGAAPTRGTAPALAGRPRLAVTRLALTNFRSYASAELVTAGVPVVLAGPNGAGKTNILDAISLLSPGRGLRGARLSEHTRRGPSAMSEALWAVAATVSRAGESYEIGTGLVSAQGSERRQVRLNGAPAASSADLGDVVQMLWLTPAMDRLFIESASGRRKFLAGGVRLVPHDEGRVGIVFDQVVHRPGHSTSRRRSRHAGPRVARLTCRICPRRR